MCICYCVELSSLAKKGGLYITLCQQLGKKGENMEGCKTAVIMTIMEHCKGNAADAVVAANKIIVHYIKPKYVQANRPFLHGEY